MEMAVLPPSIYNVFALALVSNSSKCWCDVSKRNGNSSVLLVPAKLPDITVVCGNCIPLGQHRTIRQEVDDMSIKAKTGSDDAVVVGGVCVAHWT